MKREKILKLHRASDNTPLSVRLSRFIFAYIDDGETVVNMGGLLEVRVYETPEKIWSQNKDCLIRCHRTEGNTVLCFNYEKMIYHEKDESGENESVSPDGKTTRVPTAIIFGDELNQDTLIVNETSEKVDNLIEEMFDYREKLYTKTHAVENNLNGGEEKSSETVKPKQKK